MFKKIRSTKGGTIPIFFLRYWKTDRTDSFMCCSEFVQLRAQRVIIWKRPTRAQTILNENPLTQRVVRLLRSCPTSRRGERERKMSDDEYFSVAFLFLLLLLLPSSQLWRIVEIQEPISCRSDNKANNQVNGTRHSLCTLFTNYPNGRLGQNF